jgi:hypothetical protein
VSLDFLSPARCAPDTLTSPLRRALEGADEGHVRDLFGEGIVELRGDLDRVVPATGEELVRLSPRRGFLFGVEDGAAASARVRGEGVLAWDATAALTGMAISSEQVMRRLTDLDLDDIPTAGSFAKVTAVFRRGAEGEFLVYVSQELGHYVAEAVVDAYAGLSGGGAR